MKKKFLDLGNQPITNRFLLETDFDDEYFFNLSAGFDTESKLVSLVSFVEANTMFDGTYAHRASMSTTMTNSFHQIAKKIENNWILSRVSTEMNVFFKENKGFLANLH